MEKTNVMHRIFVFLGKQTVNWFVSLGSLFVFFINGLIYTTTSLKQIPKVIKQVAIIGADSSFLIMFIALFTGMVIGLQGYYTLSNFASVGMLGSAVALSIIRELGPVLTAIMITARAGSAMAAEIGVMRISDQIDALEVMDINPMGYLVSPRITAGLIVFPLLTAVFNIVGIFGGYITGVIMLGVNSGIYWYHVVDSVSMPDIIGCFAKSLAFSLAVVTVCCHKGFYAHLRRDGTGPQAVSNATTAAVVLSCILILVLDYTLTSFLL